MRPVPPPLPLVLLPFCLPVWAEGEASAPPTPVAGTNELSADETGAATKRVNAILGELGTPFAPATQAAEAPLPEPVEGQAVAVCDGGLFFDAAESQLVYIHNVRVNDARVKLLAANRLYIQMPRKEEKKIPETLANDAEFSGYSSTPDPQPPAPQAEPQVPGEQPQAPSPQPAESITTSPEAPADVPPPSQPLEVTAYDALINSVSNRMAFTSGPAAPKLVFRQGSHIAELTEAEGIPARALADEEGNILLEAPAIALTWQEEDGTHSTLRSTGGRTLFHAATNTLVMDGPVEASYRDGESTLHCSGPFCVTLRPEEHIPARKPEGFMSQFTSMRFSGIASASATGNVQLASRMGGTGLSVSGDALYYNGLTGRVEIPGTPCMLSYGEGERNTLQAEGSLVLEENGDIHLNSKGSIEGTYERASRTEGAAPLQGTLSATAPLSFHAATGTITTRALNARDAEGHFSCTGDVLLTLTPRTADELAEAHLPAREKAGMVNMALARYKDINTMKALGQVRGALLNPASPTTPEATLSASQADVNLTTGEVLLTGAGEQASVTFRSYALSGTAEPLSPATVHLKPNGDIEVRGSRVACSIPNDKGVTTITSTDRMLLARGPRSLSLGAGTRLQSPDGIITTNGPMQAVLAPGTQPARPLSPRFPQLTYDFSGLESAETFEGATVRTAKGSLQCTQHLSVLMLPPGDTARSTMGGIRSAIATGQVLLAAKDASGRVMRAAGSRLDVNGLTGEKRLTGSRVVLEDARNRHEATGDGAAIRIDARNNARITGKRHTTSATGIREQVEENDKNKKQNKPD